MIFRPALAGLVLAIVLTTTAHAQAPSQSSDEAQVRTVVTAYRDAVARLDVSQTPDLFWQDSEVFESGGAEGTFARYLEHHLGPEFADLASFTFSEPQADVEIDGDIAPRDGDLSLPDHVQGRRAGARRTPGRRHQRAAQTGWRVALLRLPFLRPPRPTRVLTVSLSFQEISDL